MVKQLDPNLAALEMAALSPCGNRRVGAVIVGANDIILAQGYNHHRFGKPCEDASGATEADVIHAEEHAISNMYTDWDITASDFPTPRAIYVTHSPCANCLSLIRDKLGDIDIIIVESFMKFDSDKLRFDLVPPEWPKGDAEILTFGSKKYKPNNWRDVDDIGRYIGALERHLLWFKLALESGQAELLFDEETGQHHMKHLRANAGFLLTLTETEDTFYNNREKGLFSNLEFK